MNHYSTSHTIDLHTKQACGLIAIRILWVEDWDMLFSHSVRCAVNSQKLRPLLIVKCWCIAAGRFESVFQLRKMQIGVRDFITGRPSVWMFVKKVWKSKRNWGIRFSSGCLIKSVVNYLRRIANFLNWLIEWIGFYRSTKSSVV